MSSVIMSSFPDRVTAGVFSFFGGCSLQSVLFIYDIGVQVLAVFRQLDCLDVTSLMLL